MNEQAKTGEIEHSDEIFFRLEWADKDKTLNKNRWKNSGGKWTKFEGDEDRLGVTWEINRIDKFADSARGSEPISKKSDGALAIIIIDGLCKLKSIRRLIPLELQNIRLQQMLCDR